MSEADGKINEAVGMKNHVTMDGGGKCLVRPFRRQDIWKCIGFVPSTVTYGKRGHILWSEIPKGFCRSAPTKLRRDVRVNTNLYKVCCDHYRHFYICA